MKQLVIISGKGGTGKTSIVASFAALSDKPVIADCDVDAADLHLVLEPRSTEQHVFYGGQQAVVDGDACTGCGECERLCRFDAISVDSEDCGIAHVDPLACEGCGVCVAFCPETALRLEQVANGRHFLSETRFGPLVHARLIPAAENSGKLVSLVRSEARRIAEERGLDTVIIDGSPGVGCPVIASITGADLAVVVTEPTVSGLHDLKRVLELTEHFRLPALVLINKYDINEQVADRIEAASRVYGATPVGRVRYDPAVTEAQIVKQSVVEYGGDGAARDINAAWSRVSEALFRSDLITIGTGGLENATGAVSSPTSTTTKNRG